MLGGAGHHKISLILRGIVRSWKIKLKRLWYNFPSSLKSTIPTPLDTAVEDPSNLKVQIVSAISTSSTFPGTSSETIVLSSPENWANRSAMAWLLMVMGVSVMISY